MGSQRKCCECGTEGPVRHVTVRMYWQRNQRDYRYIVCKMCHGVLHSLLQSNAVGVQNGLFAPPPDKVGG